MSISDTDFQKIRQIVETELPDTHVFEAFLQPEWSLTVNVQWFCKSNPDQTDPALYHIAYMLLSEFSGIRHVDVACYEATHSVEAYRDRQHENNSRFTATG